MQYIDSLFGLLLGEPFHTSCHPNLLAENVVSGIEMSHPRNRFHGRGYFRLRIERLEVIEEIIGGTITLIRSPLVWFPKKCARPELPGLASPKHKAL